MKRSLMILSTLVSAQTEEVQAPKDLGVYGEMFAIQEKNLLEVIQNKLKAIETSGSLGDHQKAIAQKTKEKVMRPEAVGGVYKTTEPRSFTYNPSITVPYDLKDHEGKIFHLKGTTVNPLDIYAWRRPFLFVDGDDSDQVTWALQEHQKAQTHHKPKIILIKGAPFDLSQKLNISVYFDQSGTLTRKFGITQVPARVAQQDKQLLIEELKLGGKGEKIP